MNLARDVNFLRIRKVVIPTYRDDRILFTVGLIAGVTDPGYSFVSVRVHSWLVKKPCAGNARLKSPVRHRTLAPFGGITRIRFKGFVSPTSQPSGSPALSFSVRIRLGRVKSTTRRSR